MAEEFIDDIIAGADAEVVTAPIAGDDKPVVTEVVEDKDKSSSTPDADASKKAPVADPDVPSPAADVEALASQLGWNKDHKGAEAVDAATYILRSKDIQKTMKDHNKDLKNQLTGVQGSIEALKEHNTRVYQTDVKRLQSELVSLKKEKNDAVELADVDKVNELDKQIEDVQKDINTPVKTETKSNNPAYDDWIGDNDWYLTDDDMAKYADSVAEQYAGAPLDRVYKMVRQKVAEVFPEKFADEATAPVSTETVAPVKKVDAPASPVESGGRKIDAANFTSADLSPEQKSIMSQFVKGGIMTEEQYVADIAKMQ
jgi:ribosomal protein S15P/S13E